MNVLKPAGWAGVLCVFFSVAISATSSLQDQPEVVTKAMRESLDELFPGWTATPAPACPVSRPAPVTADIDFDTETDVAMIVAVPGDEPHMVVAMPRVISGAIVHDLGPLSAIPGATHLVVLPLGTAVRGPGDMFNDYLSGPTFAAASCDKPIVAFVWTGYGFRQRPIN